MVSIGGLISVHCQRGCRVFEGLVFQTLKEHKSQHIPNSMLIFDVFCCRVMPHRRPLVF